MFRSRGSDWSMRTSIESMNLSIDGFIIWWHNWEVLETRRWGPVGESRSPGMGMPLKGILCPQTLSLSLSLLPGYHEVSSFPLPCYFCLATDLKAMEPAKHEWNLWNHEPK
jgi:hypothetical protein